MADKFVNQTNIETTLTKVKGYVDSGLNNKQDSLTFDNTPTALSTNPVTSAGIKTYVDDRFDGASKAISYSNYSAMITAFNALADDVYNVGQDIYIVTTDVPDLWISSVESTSVTYTYVDDATIVNALKTNGYIQIGYYKLSPLETNKVDLTNYQEKLTAGDGISISSGNVISDFLNPLSLSGTTIFTSTELYNIYGYLTSPRTTTATRRGNLSTALSASTINGRDAIILTVNISNPVSFNAKFILTRQYQYNNAVVFSTTYSISSSNTNITQVTVSLSGDTTNGLTKYEISAVAIEEVKTISSKTSSTDVSNAIAEGIPYTTTEPSAANTNGKLQVVVLNYEPSTRYDGYIYLITEA